MQNVDVGRDALKAIKEVRRQNLVFLVSKHGGTRKLGELLGYPNGSYLNQLVAAGRVRTISETVARMIEVKLGLHHGWMDTPS